MSKVDNQFNLDVGYKCNYHCPVCQKSGKTPNLAGRFFIINETECQCNACNAVFLKKDFYKQVVTNAEKEPIHVNDYESLEKKLDI